MSVLLVHGAWHGAWCWEPVQQHLPGAVALDLPSNHIPGSGFADDVAAVRATLDAMVAPVVLVGHSYGGAVITEAGTHPNVGHLVYLCAFVLDTDESVITNSAPSPPSGLGAAMRVVGDHVVVDPAGAAAVFYGDCVEQPVDRLVPHAAAVFGEPVGPRPAWRSVPSTYVVCTLDQAIHPDEQRFFAARCTSIVELEASHSPMLSMPGRVSEIAEACHTR